MGILGFLFAAARLMFPGEAFVVVPTAADHPWPGQHVNAAHGSVDLTDAGDLAVEVSNRLDRVLHVTLSVKSRALQGRSPGGGVALLRCREAVDKVRANVRGDEKIGVDILSRALSAPLKQIVDNSGADGDVVVDEVAAKEGSQGYNAATGQYVDMYEAGVIDPLQVVRAALSHASSVAGLMLTTETLVTDVKKDKEVADAVR